MAQKYKTDFSHALITPVEYATGGNAIKAQRIFVKAPCNAQLADLADMEQDVNTALFNVALRLKGMQEADKAPEVQPDKISDEDAEQHVMMLSGNGFKLSGAFARLKSLLCHPKNPAMMDSKEPITDLLFEQMDPVDTRILLGKYLLNFINFSRQN